MLGRVGADATQVVQHITGNALRLEVAGPTSDNAMADCPDGRKIHPILEPIHQKHRRGGLIGVPDDETVLLVAIRVVIAQAGSAQANALNLSLQLSLRDTVVETKQNEPNARRPSVDREDLSVALQADARFLRTHRCPVIVATTALIR